MDKKPKLLVFASGNSNSGGSGFKELVKNSKSGKLRAEIVAVVSNNKKGGVFKIAKKEKIRFFHFSPPYTAKKYKEFVKKTKAEYIALFGWLKLVKGLKPDKTINIHPAPLPKFGGKNMYGSYVHQKVLEAFKKGKITHSAISMHFVTKEYDKGPIFFSYPVKINKNDTVKSLQQRIKKIERKWQSKITDLIVNKEIYWDMKKVKVPEWYKKQKYCPKESYLK